MPIRGLSEVRRLPRLGKLHLGIKVKSERTGAEYPKAVDYFVCPPEVKQVYGEKPKELDILIPVEDDETWANQYYRQYSRSKGLVCKGDGETCRRMIDTATGDVANHESKGVMWKEGLPCQGRECPDYKGKKCQEVMNLQFLLPKVPGLGIWQIDTGSRNSIININSCATMIRAACGRVSWIPISLTLEPIEVTNPDDGKKKVVHCLNLRHKSGLAELLAASGKPHAELLIAAPVEDEAPLDNQDGQNTAADEIANVKEPVVDAEWESLTSETNPSRMTEQELYAAIANKMEWKDSKPAKSWLVNKCRIAEDKIKQDPQAAYREASALMGWDAKPTSSLKS